MLHRRLLGPLLDAGDVPPAPVELRRALTTIDKTLHITDARLGIATRELVANPGAPPPMDLASAPVVDTEGRMSTQPEYLPDIYLAFRDRFPELAQALDGVGRTVDEAGPLDERARALVRLGIAIGGTAEGAVRSNARKALAAGATPEEITHVAVLAISVRGFPAAIAGLAWIDEVLAAET